MQEDGPSEPIIRKKNWHPLAKNPYIKRFLLATKLYGCECGFTNRLSFECIKLHAKKAHNTYLHEQTQNYLVQIYNNKQYYTYFINPSAVKDEQSHYKEPTSKKMRQFRSIMGAYSSSLKINDKKFDREVLKYFRQYITSKKEEFSDDSGLPDDLVYYFNQYMTSQFFINKINKISPDNTAELAMKHAESLQRFWAYLKEKKRTNLELEFHQEFLDIKQESQE